MYLLEVNTNPGLEYSSKLISTLIPRMIDDSLKLTIDMIFYPEDDNYHYFKSPYPVPGYSDYENMFEFQCNINY